MQQIVVSVRRVKQLLSRKVWALVNAQPAREADDKPRVTDINNLPTQRNRYYT